MTTVPERLQPLLDPVADGWECELVARRVEVELPQLVERALTPGEGEGLEAQRKIAAWAAIAAVWTSIAGVEGMNFENMPELAWQWGYPAVLLLMATVCGSLYFTFRRNHWL
mgnify:CR=1 FL=1